MPEAFVYSLRNKENNRLYVGYHKGEVDDGYICSSRVVLEEYKTDPNKFERFIISTGTVEDMQNLESLILNFVDAANNVEYYNQHNNNGKFHHTEPHTDMAKRKMSKAHLNRTKYAKGWKFTEEQRNRLKKSHSKRGESWRNNISKANVERYENGNNPLKEGNSKKVECPHCGKIGQHNAMKRWHFDNCKHESS